MSRAQDLDAELMQQAIAARARAYVPYSRFAVGAALLTADGRIFQGCNVENASYGLTCCAERVAIFKAISEGAREFRAMAVVADTPEPVSPCGACRQVLVEFAPGMRLILGNLKGASRVTTPADLLPGFFGSQQMVPTGATAEGGGGPARDAAGGNGEGARGARLD